MQSKSARRFSNPPTNEKKIGNIIKLANFSPNKIQILRRLSIFVCAGIASICKYFSLSGWVLRVSNRMKATECT